VELICGESEKLVSLHVRRQKGKDFSECVLHFHDKVDEAKAHQQCGDAWSLGDNSRC